MGGEGDISTVPDGLFTLNETNDDLETLKDPRTLDIMRLMGPNPDYGVMDQGNSSATVTKHIFT